MWIWIALAAANPVWSDLVSASDWEAVATKNMDPVGEIQIWSKTIDGVQCLRADGQSDLPAELLIALVADVEGEVSWSSAGLTEAKILGKGGDYLDYYQYLDTPGWTLAADRFWILRGKYFSDEGRLMFAWDRIGERGGPYSEHYAGVLERNPRAVEPPINVGGWVFDTKEGVVSMQYYLCTDSGGSIPKAVQDIAARSTVPSVLVDVVKEGKRRSASDG